jgi:autotransporter translocation and assembly factor TamB
VASSSGFRVGERSIDALELTLTPGERNRLTVRLEGDVDTALDLDFAFSAEGAEGRLAPFAVAARDLAISSEEPLAIAWQRSTRTLSVGGFCLRVRASRACSDPVVFGPEGMLELRLELDERYEGNFAGKTFSVDGQALGSASVTWQAWSPTGASIDLDMSRLAVDPFVADATAEPIRWRDGRISGSYTAERTEFFLNLDSATLGSLDAAFAIGKGDLSGSLVLDDVSLVSLSDFLPEVAIQGGLARANLRLRGTPESPDVEGTATIEGATIGVSGIDTVLEDLDVAIALRDRGATAQGEASLGGGAIGFEAACCEAGGLTGTVIGSRNRLRLPNGLDLSVSPSLDVAIDPQLLTVTGSIVVHDGVFEHSGLTDNGVAVSDDVVRLDAAEEGVRRFDLRLDLRTLIEPGFVLRSRNLESTLGGDLRFIMPPRTPPSLFGNLEVLGGELRAYGQALRLTEGALGFVGDPLNPDLAINAEREIRSDNQRVGFRVTGTLDEPLFELFSDPQRSNEETLSYLLRGRPPDVGVSADGTAMALSLGASAVNQSGVLSSLNAIPGLSGVSIGAEGRDEEMAATISAYVGNRLYLSYGVGIYEPINALTARLYLRSRLWLEVLSRLESSLDLFYRFDRD